MRLLAILGLLSFLFFKSWGQDNLPSSSSHHETGVPLLENYTNEDYGAFEQNWDVLQDSAGILYFGNGDGVLLYDGAYWELIRLPNQGTPFSLALDASDRVYVGAIGELGYLEADERGQLGYVSLLPYLPEEDQKFVEVRETIATEEGIFFRSTEALYRWTGENFKVWRAEGERKGIRAYWVNNTLFVQIFQKGLMHLREDALNMVPGGEFFADKEIQCILPYDKSHILIGTRHHGLFLYDGKQMTYFSTEIDDYLLEKYIYKGILLRDSTFAFGTLEGGLVIIDKGGHQKLVLNDENGLNSPLVLGLYQDKSGIIWAGLNRGIAKVEFPSTITRFGANNELDGNVLKIIRYQDKLFAGTDRGLYFSDFNPSANGSTFQQFPGFSSFIWDIMLIQDKLLVSVDYSIQEIKNGKARKISDWVTSRLVQSTLDTNRVFVGLKDGFGSLYYQDGVWVEEGKIPDIHGLITDIIETSEGTLWLETNVNHILRISFQDKNQAKKLVDPVVETFGIQDGLPNDVGQLYNLDNEIIFTSIYENKTYRFHASTQSFQLFPEINKKLGKTDKRVELREIDAKGNIWGVAFDEKERKSYIVSWKQSDGTYQTEELGVERAIDFIGYDIYPEMEDSVIWFGGKGLTRFDMKTVNTPVAPFNALIRKVNYQSDSVIFGGKKMSTGNVMAVLPFKDNNFRFSYASTSYANEQANQYQYFLEGFDQHWSEWTSETQKDYTNLPEGKYTFKIRGRNIFGQTSGEDQYVFSILPPWYRTWWAYGLYALAFFSVIGLVVRWRSGQLQREKEALEATVKERTEEIQLKNKQLAQQAEQLKEMDQLKSRLFANISHEFRTPLTLIKGPVDQLITQPEKKLSQESALMIGRNTDRLLRLVNQLLDLSKLDAGKLEVNPTDGDVYKWLRTISSAFGSHAVHRGMNFQVQIPQQALTALFDHDKLEQIVYNLLSNAFKFTPDAGEVIIKVEYHQPQLTIEVADTGKGIPSERLPYIFDRFYQVDDSYTREQEGTGIGLALTKELVALMGGEIKVDSKPGEGTVFTVALPLAGAEIDNIIVSENEEEVMLTYDTEENTDNVTALDNELIHEEASLVLVVEDNADMRSFIKEQLKNDYEVLEAVHGKEGLSLAFEKIPDLIITDLMMPHIDGVALCHQLRNDERTSHIPVIMLTAKAGEESKIEGLETGADDYLTKPFSVDELKVRVKNLITQREQLRRRFSREMILQPSEVTITNKDEEFLQHAISVVEAQISNDQFTVEQFQQQMGMSRMQLHRKLKALTDQSSSEFIRLIRMKRAAQLFMQKEITVSEVAYEVGFSDPSYFAKCFKEVHGIPPKEYLQKMHSS